MMISFGSHHFVDIADLLLFIFYFRNRSHWSEKLRWKLINILRPVQNRTVKELYKYILT